MNLRRLQGLLTLFALGCFTIGATPTGPTTPVQRFVDAFNKGDEKTLLAHCDTMTGIIDDFPPHAWMSCQKWYAAYLAFFKQDGDADAVVTAGTPTHVNVTGDVAYIVVPVTLRFKHKGKLVTQTGSTWTLVVRNTRSGWLITAWAWADGKS